MNKYAHFIGVDEVGRGPLAGPVAVGVVMLPGSYDRRFLRGIRDSKRLTPRARETWYLRAKEAASREELSFAVSCVGAPIIDRRGISFATRCALHRAITRLDARPEECLVLLDGGLYAPEEFIYQETIIRGESREPVIALASIIAKVYRDRKMARLSRRFPGYLFEKNKGYGTYEHRRSVKKLGPCDIHRRSFLHM